MNRTDSTTKGPGYVQLFIYRVPNKNRSAMNQLLGQIVNKLREHGTLHSDFLQLYSREAFQGFTTIADTFSTTPDEALWIELDHYKERKHRDEVMASLGKDPSAGALFRQLTPLVSEGYRIVMGEFEGTIID